MRWKIGLAVHRRARLDIPYVSLTDFAQHTHATSEPLADRFFQRLRASITCQI
jgi:hypothetical protein